MYFVTYSCDGTVPSLNGSAAYMNQHIWLNSERLNRPTCWEYRKTGEIRMGMVDHSNILVVLLHGSFAGCFHWGKLGKWYKGSLCFSYNCVWIYNSLNKSFNYAKFITYVIAPWTLEPDDTPESIQFSGSWSVFSKATASASCDISQEWQFLDPRLSYWIRNSRGGAL